MDRDKREQERPDTAEGCSREPFISISPSFNSDSLFLQFGNRLRKHLSKRNSRTDSYRVGKSLEEEDLR
jgi:hypothetical protein